MVIRVLVALAAMLAVPVARACAHPVHMTFTEMRFGGRGNTVELLVKVFADDFSTAAARYTRSHLDSGKVIDDSRGFAYLQSRVRLGNRSATIPLTPCGVRTQGETLVFCLRGTTTGNGTALRMSNSLLTDLFNDQVNVVRSVQGRRRSSRMFVRGDGWKPIG